jgi:methionine aminotransferase
MEDFKGTYVSKLQSVGTTIFTVMSALAHEHRAINLSQGFPDFKVSGRLISLVSKYMRKGFNQYAPMQGVPRLREVIAEKTRALYNASYDSATEINITAGATQAIYTCIAALIRNDDDEVIIFEPAYDSYAPAVRLNGGMVKCAQMKLPDYRIDWKVVQKMISARTRMIIINSPHNPTGSILTADDLRTLDKITRNSDIVVLSDEVYEHLVYDGKRHESVCRYPSLAQRSFVVGSFGKTFHATGWKIGFVLAPGNLMTEFRKAHQFIVFTCNTAVQHALAEFLEDRNNYDHLPAFYQQKRDYFTNLVSNSRFRVVPSFGTYFQLLDYSRITDEPEKDFAIRITREFGVASIPVSAFYHTETNNGVLRFCFAKKEETLEKAAAILCRI